MKAMRLLLIFWKAMQMRNSSPNCLIWKRRLKSSLILRQKVISQQICCHLVIRRIHVLTVSFMANAWSQNKRKKKSKPCKPSILISVWCWSLKKAQWALAHLVCLASIMLRFGQGHKQAHMSHLWMWHQLLLAQMVFHQSFWQLLAWQAVLALICKIGSRSLMMKASLFWIMMATLYWNRNSLLKQGQC